MNWFKRIFKKKDEYRPRVRTLYDFLTQYTEALHEQRAMRGFIWDILRHNCGDFNKSPSKKLIRRYSINYDSNRFAWYLLEKYSEGKIIIKEDELQSESGTGRNS